MKLFKLFKRTTAEKPESLPLAEELSLLAAKKEAEIKARHTKWNAEQIDSNYIRVVGYLRECAGKGSKHGTVEIYFQEVIERLEADGFAVSKVENQNKHEQYHYRVSYEQSI